MRTIFLILLSRHLLRGSAGRRRARQPGSLDQFVGGCFLGPLFLLGFLIAVGLLLKLIAWLSGASLGFWVLLLLVVSAASLTWFRRRRLAQRTARHEACLARIEQLERELMPQYFLNWGPRDQAFEQRLQDARRAQESYSSRRKDASPSQKP